MDMRCETWNLNSMCRSQSLRTAARDLSSCRLDSGGYWRSDGNKGGTELGEDLLLSMEKGMKIMN
jgi:hypothetical protein